MKSFIQANWPAPQHIHAYTTLRTGGVSITPYDQFNMGEHVGDAKEHVATNRNLLKSWLHLPNNPVWLRQTHSNIVIAASLENTNKEADASYTNKPQEICVVQTADCLPILVCNRKGTHVAAIHAGWRGLANGIIEACLDRLQLPPEDLLIWLGPAISSKHYEVGTLVRDAFLKITNEAEQAFIQMPNERWLADLYALARIRLHIRGVTQISGGDYCTYSDSTRFYSYRRDGQKTGRIASLIWMS